MFLLIDGKKECIMKYCRNCTQNVQPVKNFSWVWFIVFLGIFYLPYYLLLKKKVCPMCGARNFEHKHSNKRILEDKMN